MKPFDILYKLSRKNKIANHLFSLIYHCDIPMKLKVGNNIRFVHKGLGVVISEGATIGNNVCIQHHVLIGEKNGTDFPVIEDRCTNQSTSQPIGTPTLRSASGQGERPRRKPRAPDAPKIKHDKMKQFYMIDIERKRW